MAERDGGVTAAQRLAAVAGSGLASAAVLLPTSPANMPYTYRDSGMFLYGGWQMLQGALPYVDFWDHKPPMIFVVNAAGLLLGGGSRWGVWALELVAVWLAALMGLWLMQQVWGWLPAIAGSGLWLASLVFVVDGGNHPTEFTLPLQFGAIWLTMAARERDRLTVWRWLVVGTLGGVALLFKQTAIGVWLAVGVAALLLAGSDGHWRRGLSVVALIGAGALVPVVAVVVAFMAAGALDALWSATMAYNFSYVATETGAGERLGTALLTADAVFRYSGLLWLGLGGLVLFAIGQWRKWPTTVAQRGLGLMAGVALVIELGLISLSGRAYAHYFMTLLPALALLAALAVHALQHGAAVVRRPGLGSAVIAGGFVAMLAFALRPAAGLAAYLATVGPGDVIGYVERETAADDTVLLWGAEAEVNFFTGRSAPSRYVYQYPLYSDGYTDLEMVGAFLDDLEAGPPALIVDTGNADAPLWRFAVESPDTAARVAALRGRYAVGDTVGGWTVYRLKDRGGE